MNTNEYEPHYHNESFFIPIFIFFITTLCLVYIINKVELSTKDETENAVNNLKNKII